MRLLFLSNLYPPIGGGGYEQWCQEVAEGLQRRGHAVAVLTSRTWRDEVVQPEPDWVHRELFMEMEFRTRAHSLHFFTRREAREQTNLDYLRQIVSTFQPDLIFIWGMWNLPRSLPALAEQSCPGRVVYYLADYWPTLPSQNELYWQAPSRNFAARISKALLRLAARQILQKSSLPGLEFARVIFPSAYLHDEIIRRGVPMQETQVITGAIDTRPFIQANGAHAHVSGERQQGNALSLLYAGRLSPEKGIETAIQAMQELVQRHGIRDVKLSIIGGGERGYVARLRQIVQQAELGEWIDFQGPIPKDSMPALYRQFDAFVFTSTWQEPFGRVLVEAMASGVAVIGTATGGAGEILVDHENALTFTPGDASRLAEQILRLHQQPSLRQQLVENGRRIASEKYDISRMVAEIEAYLKSVLTE